MPRIMISTDGFGTGVGVAVGSGVGVTVGTGVAMAVAVETGFTRVAVGASNSARANDIVAVGFA